MTSRWPDWRGHARAVDLRVWTRAEPVALLRARPRHTDDDPLDELAGLVGDLPPALGEAAACLEQTGEDLSVYVGLVRAGRAPGPACARAGPHGARSGGRPDGVAAP